MKLSSILPHLLYPFKNEHELLSAIAELSLKFTQERSKISDYLNDPRLTSAYTAFYLTTNIPKLKGILPWLPPEWMGQLKHCDFVDLGAGPGTFSIAWHELMGEISGSFVQLETSPIMREQAARLWQGLYPQTPLIQLSRWQPSPERERFLLFGHAANEMGAQQSINYIKAIEPAHILFIEPGTKSFFPEMLHIREHLIKSGYRVLYPCPAPHACPMQETSDWCHQFIQVQQDPEVERLSQMIRMDRKLLPLTVQAYSRALDLQQAERIVRVLPETKFSYEWEVCTQNDAGTANQLQHYQVMKRGLQKDEQQRLSKVLAGRAVVSEIEKPLTTGKRVKIEALD
jgi:ribosomal protein RSM22 (predicted rRNA methylase)